MRCTCYRSIHAPLGSFIPTEFEIHWKQESHQSDMHEHLRNDLAPNL